MKKVAKKIITAGFLSCLMVAVAQADNVTTLLKSAEQNYAAGNYSKALEDLNWASKEIANQHLNSMKSLLPTEIEGMKGVDAEGGSVLGFRGISKQYNSTDGSKSVTISLLSGGNTTTGNGLSALMGMAASLGAMQGGTNAKIVIEKGYRGQFLQEKGEKTGTLTFTLNDGKMITIETYGYQHSAMAEKVAKMLDIAKIESAF